VLKNSRAKYKIRIRLDGRYLFTVRSAMVGAITAADEYGSDAPTSRARPRREGSFAVRRLDLPARTRRWLLRIRLAESSGG